MAIVPIVYIGCEVLVECGMWVVVACHILPWLSFKINFPVRHANCDHDKITTCAAFSLEGLTG